MHKKFQVDWTNIDGVMAIIVISPLHYGRSGRRPPEWPKGPLGARRAPQPSAGARRKGAECPELLVIFISCIQLFLLLMVWWPEVEHSVQ